jgi:hypothetical protein
MKTVPMRHKACGRCGLSFTCRRSDARFCPSCRFRQWAERHPRIASGKSRPARYPGEAPKAIGRSRCGCGCGRYIWAGRRWAGEACRARYRRAQAAIPTVCMNCGENPRG